MFSEGLVFLGVIQPAEGGKMARLQPQKTRANGKRQKRVKACKID